MSFAVLLGTFKRRFCDLSVVGSLAAQGVNFVTMLVPVLLGKFDSAAMLVVSGSIASVLIYGFTLNFPSVYPTVLDGVDEQLAKRCALIGTLLVTILLASGALVFARVGLESLSKPCFGAAAYALGFGLYLISVSVLMREANSARFARTRLFYAFMNGSLTLAVCALVEDSAGLVFGVSLSFALGGIYATGDFFRSLVVDSLSGCWDGRTVGFFRKRAGAGVAAILGGLSVQASSISLGLAGSYAGLWGSVLRVAGGTAGVAHQVLSPPFEIELSRAVRERSATFRVVGVGVASSVLLSILAYATVAASLLVGTHQGGVHVETTQLLVVAGVFTLGLVAPAVASKALVMLGADRYQLVWGASRLLVTALILSFARGLLLIWCLAALEFVSGVAYLVLVLMRSKAFDRVTVWKIEQDLSRVG